jgi:TonB family protein
VTHRPKTAALVAYAEDLLSERGRTRLERHLAGCEVCRRELSAILLYEQVSDDARRAPVPEVDFDRMERVLAQEAERVSREIVRARRRPSWTWGALALAAAALVALYLAWPTDQAPAPVAEGPVEPAGGVTPSPAESAPLRPVVTLAAGQVERVDGSGARTLRAGDALPEGSVVRTPADGVLHARLSDGTGVVVQAGSELRLVRAREDQVLLELTRGRVDSAVAPLASGSTYVVLAAGHSVAVRGTQFAVDVRGGGVAVDLAEGSVEVSTPSGERVGLRAPSRWSSAGALTGSPSVLLPRERDVADETLAPLTLAHPDLVRWEVDGITLEAARLELLMRPGEHEVRGWDARGRLHTGFVQVGVEPVVLQPSALTAEAPRVRPGHLEQWEITSVLHRGRRQLSACYERSLRVYPEVRGRVRLRVTVDATGDVQRVSVVGADPTATTELQQCVATHAERWAFRPPGGPVTFEVPLAFSARAP